MPFPKKSTVFTPDKKSDFMSDPVDKKPATESFKAPVVKPESTRREKFNVLLNNLITKIRSGAPITIQDLEEFRSKVDHT